ncbi:MAG: bifunctional UDP-sugar hydrolase/5'-nucleotidase [Aerococcus sp.]|nr:bifunctional UDP-sugar hydrolase/5'-nucleotidase [Aerococcus sp.]
MKLTILETSDVHGYLTAQSDKDIDAVEAYGYTRTATMIKRLRQELDHPVLYIDNGDSILGSPLAAYQHGYKHTPESITKVYNAMDVDYWIPGNHEFNFGQEYLFQAKKLLNCPLLCANIVDDEGTPALGQPYVIRDYQGVKVAILGLTTMYIPHWEEPEHIEGLHFESAVETAKRWVPYLKEQRQCDIIIVSYHGGFARYIETGERIEEETGENEAYDLATSGLPIDVLLTGHQHREIVGRVDGIPVIQPGSKGMVLGRVDLTIEAKGTHYAVTDSQAELIDCRQLREDEEILNLVKADVSEVQKWLDQPLGETAMDLTVSDLHTAQMEGHPYFDLINEIQMSVSDADISATSAFSDDIKGFAGDISYRDVMDNYPFPNKPTMVQVTGKELKEILEKNVEYFVLDEQGEITINPAYIAPKYQAYNYDFYTGISYQVDIAKPVGERISHVTYHDEPIQPDQALKIVYNNYRAGGGGDFPVLDQEHVVEKWDIEMPEVIADYIAKHSPVKPNSYKGWTLVNSKKDSSDSGKDEN